MKLSPKEIAYLRDGVPTRIYSFSGFPPSKAARAFSKRIERLQSAGLIRVQVIDYDAATLGAVAADLTLTDAGLLALKARGS